MARFLKSPRKLLTSPRITVRAGKFDYSNPNTLPDVPLVQGMNQPESRIYYALNDLGINFVTQANILGGDILGGGRLDFLLLDYLIDLEYNGPFHGTSFGLGRDSLRNAGVQSLGYRVVTLGLADLPDLKNRILQEIGIPVPGLKGVSL